MFRYSIATADNTEEDKHMSGLEIEQSISFKRDGQLPLPLLRSSMCALKSDPQTALIEVAALQVLISSGSLGLVDHTVT